MRKLLIVLLLLAALLSGCAMLGKSGPLTTLTVTFLDVGKADCILLEADGCAAMIDTGNNGDAEAILQLLDDKGIKRLDFLLLTHLDKDHIGGADILIENIPIGAVYAPDYDKGNKQYAQYIAALEKMSLQPIHPTSPVQLALGDGTLTLLPAAQSEYEQSNDYSIMAELDYGSVSFLFAGDAESERLTEYLTGTPRTFDLLKVPHHGREDACSEEFFASVSPQYAVITCDNDHMPDNTVIQFLQSLGTKVYGTVQGTIVVTTDGSSITIEQ